MHPQNTSTVLVPLGYRAFAIIDAVDAESVLAHTWHAMKGPWTTYAYRGQWENGRARTIYLHRLIMDDPIGQEVDHRNGNGLDCRRENLRVASRSMNGANTRKRSDSRWQFKGVTQRKSGRWRARIMHNQQWFYLGTFDTEEEAARAYDVKALELFGEFARLNF